MSDDSCQCSLSCDDAFADDLIGWNGCMDSCQARCSGTPRWNLNLGYAEYFPKSHKQSISSMQKISLAVLGLAILLCLIFIIRKLHSKA